MALDRTCKPKGKSLLYFVLKKFRGGSLLEKAILFRFRPSQISQQLRLGKQAHAPTQTRILVIFSWANISSTRRVKSCMRYSQSMDRATIHHLYDKSLHGFPHMCWEFYSKHETFFLCFIYLFCFFEWLRIFSRTQDEKIGRMTYLDTLAPPSLNEAQ